MTTTSRVKVVAAIPSYNNEGAIGEVVSRARKYVDEVIVVNDGSLNGTAERAKESGAIVVNHAINKGYGEAIKSCFEVAKANAADILVILDGDGQHEPDDIPKVIASILKGEADLVVGSRFISKGCSMPKYREFGIKVITFLWNFGSKVKVSDSQSGFRAYAKNMLQNLSLTERGMAVSIEILEQARRYGAVIKEVPISCRYVSSILSLKAIKHGLNVALWVIKIRFKRKHMAK